MWHSSRGPFCRTAARPGAGCPMRLDIPQGGALLVDTSCFCRGRCPLPSRRCRPRDPAATSCPKLEQEPRPAKRAVGDVPPKGQGVHRTEPREPGDLTEEELALWTELGWMEVASAAPAGLSSVSDAVSLPHAATLLEDATGRKRGDSYQ